MSGTNKEIAERFEVAFAANDVAAFDELLDPDVVDHSAEPDQKPGLAGWKETNAKYEGTFTELQGSVLHVIGDGDLVATHWTLTGTHQKEFLGVPATSRRVTVEGMNVYRIAGGRITEMWGQMDMLGLKAELEAPDS